MSALDKLSQRANVNAADAKATAPIIKEKEKEQPAQKKEKSGEKNISEKQVQKNSAAEKKTNTKGTQKKETVPRNKKTVTDTKNRTVKPTPAKQTPGKHPGGRNNTRGEAGKDYKMINIEIPIDVYEKLRDKSGGNMTYFLNDLIKKNV